MGLRDERRLSGDLGSFGVTESLSREMDYLGSGSRLNSAML
jgi:hypothetical protein